MYEDAALLADVPQPYSIAQRVAATMLLQKVQGGTALHHSRSKCAKLQLKDRCLQLALDQKIFYAEALLPGLIYAKNALQAAS